MSILAQAYVLDRVSEEDRGHDTPCWVWQMHVSTRTGYGQIGMKMRDRLAHRFSFQAFVGPIPDGLQIDHLCRVRACVNPDHLEAVTQQQNGARGRGPAAEATARDACAAGHPYTPSNTRISPRGHRECRECGRIKQQAIRDRRVRGRAPSETNTRH